MTLLKDTKILRGGSTKRYLHYENKTCIINVDKEEKTLNLNLSIRSKGGGSTEIRIVIGKDDIPKVLNEIFENIPEEIKTTFSVSDKEE